MRNPGTRFFAAAGAALLVTAILSFAVAREGNAAEAVIAPCPGTVDAAAPALDPVAGPTPAPSCLDSQPLSCADLPVPIGATCSCTSTLLETKCRQCGTGDRGQVLSTTCTVRTSCTNPPCEIQGNYSRTGYSCTVLELE